MDIIKKMNLSELVTTVTVNFKTPELVKECIQSFAEFYPDVLHIIVDNGGCEQSTEVLQALADQDCVFLVQNSKNIGHGPALNQAISLVNTPYIFTLDSDTRIENGGFLEKMLDRFGEDWKLFALGWLRWVNLSGVAYPDQSTNSGRTYIHPYACMIDRCKFSGLYPFVHTGAPAIHLMQDAKGCGYELENFPVQDYIWHKEAGTRGVFGGKWRVGTDEQPGKWHRYGI